MEPLLIYPQSWIPDTPDQMMNDVSNDVKKLVTFDQELVAKFQHRLITKAFTCQELVNDDRIWGNLNDN